MLKATDRDGLEDKLPNLLLSLEWAFAGTSTTSHGSDRSMSHTVWVHWVDSKSENPAPDKGDMYLQPDGDVLERGSMTDPHTGHKCDYEELWHDLEISKVGTEKDRVCVVLQADSVSLQAKGMVIRIGEWCQGIIKIGNELTVERWQWLSQARNPVEGDFGTAEDDVPKDPEKNQWERLVRLGTGTLPCTITFQSDLLFNKGLIKVADLEWEVVEHYRW